MKVIFLDIDGVLNSMAYDRERMPSDGSIDKTRLALLKGLVDKTDAKIVLSTSWRKHWKKDESLCDDTGKFLNSTFAEAGLKIYDKTPETSGYLERSEEIRRWLKDNPDTESFVIFDDNMYNWGDLSKHYIQTSYYRGRGLDEEHILKGLEILM